MFRCSLLHLYIGTRDVSPFKYTIFIYACIYNIYICVCVYMYVYIYYIIKTFLEGLNCLNIKLILTECL